MAEPSEGRPEASNWIVVAKAGVRLLTAVNLGWVAKQVRQRSTLPHLKNFRTEVINETWNLNRVVVKEPLDVVEFTYQASQFCRGANRAMAEFLRVDAVELNCQIKMMPFTDPAGNISGQVVTVGSARAGQNRHAYHINRPTVEQNSAWASILGRKDLRWDWHPNPLECFACNDLSRHGDIYVSHLDEWDRYYKSTMVFPIRYLDPEGQHVQIGTLTFDSMRAGVFSLVPDVYEFVVRKRNLAGYTKALNENSAFHYGMAMAEMLTSASRAYKNYITA